MFNSDDNKIGEIVLAAPLVTIGFTCYNAQDTIERALRSALAQTWQNTEVLVVDDCSTDDSWVVLQAFASQHPVIRLIRSEANGGVGAARRRLVEEARGEYIAFFDDDDESHPERVAWQYQRIIAYEATHGSRQVLCYGNRVCVGFGEGHFQGFGIGRWAPEPYGNIVADYVLGLTKDTRYCWGLLGSGTLMASSTLFKQIGNFDPRYRRCEELDLAIRAAFSGAHFISVDEPIITQYRTEAAEKSENVNLHYRLMVLEKHKEYAQSRHAYRGAIANIRASYHHINGRRWRGRAWRVLALMLFSLSLSRQWLRARSSSLKESHYAPQ